jgi:hypothetical protein
VYIYDWSGSAWVQRGSVLTASDAAVYDEFGISVALNDAGTVLAVGATRWEGTATDQGGVYIYDYAPYEGSSFSVVGRAFCDGYYFESLIRQAAFSVAGNSTSSSTSFEVRVEQASFDIFGEALAQSYYERVGGNIVDAQGDVVGGSSAEAEAKVVSRTLFAVQGGSECHAQMISVRTSSHHVVGEAYAYAGVTAIIVLETAGVAEGTSDAYSEPNSTVQALMEAVGWSEVSGVSSATYNTQASVEGSSDCTASYQTVYVEATQATVEGSSDCTASYQTVYVEATQATVEGSSDCTASYLTVYVEATQATVEGSSDCAASYQTVYVEVTQATAEGSSDCTASYQTVYVEATQATVEGSSDCTASYQTVYVEATQATAEGSSDFNITLQALSNSVAETQARSLVEVSSQALCHSVFVEAADSAADSFGAFARILESIFQAATGSLVSGYYGYGLAYKVSVLVTTQTEHFVVTNSDDIVRAYSEPERDVIVYAHAPME